MRERSWEESMKYFLERESLWEKIEELPGGPEQDHLILLLKRADKAWNAGDQERAWELLEEIEKELARVRPTRA